MKTTSAFLCGLLFAAILASGCGDGTDAPGSPDTTAAGPVIEDLTAVPRSEAVDTAGVDAAAEGSMAPDFRLPTLGGEPFHLAAHRGEVVLVNFWATWCAPCRLEMPGFQRVWEDYRDRGVVIIGLSTDRGVRADVERWVHEREITYPVAFAPGSVVRAYGGARVLPTSILIGPGGRIAHRVEGFYAEPTLRASIRRLLPEAGRGGTDRDLKPGS